MNEDNTERGTDGPNPIDRHVGLRIRLRRRELGVTQAQLAEAVGLTFQQIQKYERAANRVSASKLWDLARALKTSVAYFYDGLGETETIEPPNPTRVVVEGLLLTPEGLDLAEAFPRIRQGRVRRTILELTRTLTDSADEHELEPEL